MDLFKDLRYALWMSHIVIEDACQTTNHTALDNAVKDLNYSLRWWYSSISNSPSISV